MPGSNGGSRTTNYLDIMPSASDHNATYYCKAKNEYIDKSTSDGLRISIQCQWSFTFLAPMLLPYCFQIISVSV